MGASTIAVEFFGGPCDGLRYEIVAGTTECRLPVVPDVPGPLHWHFYRRIPGTCRFQHVHRDVAHEEEVARQMAEFKARRGGGA